MALSVTADAKEFRFSRQTTYKTGSRAALEVSSLYGSVLVYGYEGDEIVVDAIKRVNAVSIEEAQELAKQVSVSINHSGSRLFATAAGVDTGNSDRPLWKRLLGIGSAQVASAVDFAIAVPERCDITIKTSGGTISVADVRGKVTIAGSSSDIRLASIVGVVDVRTAAGLTSGELLFGPVSIRQPAGRIDLRMIEGDITIRSVSAEISIEQERGKVDLTTSSSSVSVKTNLDSSDDYFVQTESGSIDLLVPVSSSGRFEISSEMGDITADIPAEIQTAAKHRMVGVFGYGGSKIILSSLSGNVTVAQF